MRKENTEIYKRSMKYFLTQDTETILNLFYSWGARFELESYWDNRFPAYVFIKGNQKDPVLLVAHVDTVWGDKEIKVEERNGVFYSSTILDEEGIGIGADDRAGVAILWSLMHRFKGGPSLLLTTGEEIGIGPDIIAREELIKEKLPEHLFAIQFDRYGSSAAIYYNDEPVKFRNKVRNITKRDVKKGKYSTDIKSICYGVIPAINLPVGFENAHKKTERLVMDNWYPALENGVAMIERRTEFV